MWENTIDFKKLIAFVFKNTVKIFAKLFCVSVKEIACNSEALSALNVVFVVVYENRFGGEDITGVAKISREGFTLPQTAE